jgi:hypothetical protein
MRLNTIKRHAVSIALVGLLCLALPALAEEYSYEGSIEFDIPAGWEVEDALDTDDAGDGGRLEIGPASEAFHIWMWDRDEDDWENIDAALSELDAELDEMLDGMKHNPDVKKFEINGLPAVSLTGTGKHHDADIEFEVCVIVAEKPVIFLTCAAPAAFDAQDVADFEKFVKSVRPAGGGGEEEGE